MVDTTPLQKIVAKQVDDDILAAVAQAHKQGRRLFISTATMEAGGFVIWDMGAIAASGKPGALEFLRKVMLASASIHGAFPRGVSTYAHPHGGWRATLWGDACGGGTAAQVFFSGFTLDLDAAQRQLGIQNWGLVRPFIVPNGKLTVPWQLVSLHILPIVDRSFNGLIGSQVVGDLYRIYVVAQRDGIKSNNVMDTWNSERKP